MIGPERLLLIGQPRSVRAKVGFADFDSELQLADSLRPVSGAANALPKAAAAAAKWPTERVSRSGVINSCLFVGSNLLISAASIISGLAVRQTGVRKSRRLRAAAGRTDRVV